MRTQTANEVFDALRNLLASHEDPLAVKSDEEAKYYLNTPEEAGDEFFAGTEVKKRYVSFHLMPVYCYPDLLDEVPESLQKRMQGKSCFNFTKVDDELFGLLAELVQTSLERYRSEGKLG